MPSKPSKELEYWFPLLAWLGLIYFFSTDNFSAGETSRIIEPLLRFLFPFLAPYQVNFLHGVIRKLGHVSEYGMLAVLAYRALRIDRDSLLDARIHAFLLVILVASTDEFHQSLTQYRGASPVDVGYDGLGGLLVLWVATILHK